MALDHGPRHSMTCVSRFWLSHPVGRESFAAAMRAVAVDSPLLAAHRRGGTWRPVDFDTTRQIEWADSGVPAPLDHLDPFDTLTRWTVRVGRLGDLGLEDGPFASRTGTLVVARYQHASGDALATAAVMRQVCAALSGTRPSPPTRADLEARLRLHHPVAAARRRLRWELGRIAKYFLRVPSAYAPDPVAEPTSGPPPITCIRLVVPATLTGRLLAASRAAGATLNDLLLAGFFRALRPGMPPESVIRIAVPTSLRPQGNTAFCNQVSMVFLDRTSTRAIEPPLLGGITAEMNHVKRWRLGNAMHSFLAAGLRLGERPLGWFMRLPIVSTTAVLSNVGQPIPAPAAEGPVAVVAHDAVSPLRPGTNVSVLAALHAGRLGLTLRYAPDRVSPGRAQELVEAIVNESAAMLGIERSAG